MDKNDWWRWRMMVNMPAWGSGKGLDRVVQFERFGFVRIDSVSGDGVVAYFTHG